MKIVNLETFRSLPRGTVFLKYKPCYFEELSVKQETLETDFISEEIAACVRSNGSTQLFDRLQEMEEKGASYPLDFDYTGRDGCFEPDQLFAVYELEDVEALIFKLHECRTLAYLIPLGRTH